MEIPMYLVDAFAPISFMGNAAAVCLIETDLEDGVRQSIAEEMKQSETAFLQRIGDGHYRLRWFTPVQEVQLCGHATLASAHILWTEQGEQSRLAFDTMSGRLVAEKTGEKVLLDFPTTFVEPVSSKRIFAKVFEHMPLFVGQGGNFWFAELDSEDRVRDFQADHSAIASLGLDGLIITAQSDSEADDFVSRVFAPNLGIPEDPVTGSAHCVLSAYWSQKLGKTTLSGYQASSRGGFVQVEFLGARTLLKGTCVTTLKGKLAL